MISSAILEYLTSFVLEKFFGARWWDYSTIPLNIHGRICLSCSIAFGLAGVILLPGAIIPIIGFVDSIPSEPATVIAIFLAGFLGDLISRTSQGRNDYQIEKTIKVEK